MNHERGILLGLIGLFLALAIALGSGVVSLVGLSKVANLGHENKANLERVDALTAQLVELRKENDKANCVAANVGRAAVRAALKDSLLALVPVGTTLTAEQQGRVDLYDQKVDARLPFRDCSPAGIEAFLGDQPPDPALKPTG